MKSEPGATPSFAASTRSAGPKAGKKFRTALFAVAVLAVFQHFVACNMAAEVKPNGGPATQPSTAFPSVFLAVGDGGRTAGPALFREMAFAYWDAFNAYDIDRVLDYLEPSYRAKQEEQIRKDLGRLKRFRVKLGISEQAPPIETAPGAWEMLLRIKEPLGTRSLLMVYQEFEGRWYVSHAEEVR